jgi:hypothetical protein
LLSYINAEIMLHTYVIRDLKKIGINRWRIKAMDRTELRKICEAAKVLLQQVYSHAVE